MLLKIDPFSPDAAVIRQAAEVIRAGGLLVVPTETVYGLAADPFNDAAMEALYRAKGRRPDKPVALFAAGMKPIEEAGFLFSEQAKRVGERFWPGPLTLVLRGPGEPTGFRVPDYAVPQLLLEDLGQVLAVTSANLAGQPEALKAAEAMQSIGNSVDLILDAGPSPGGTASSVVLDGEEGLQILREGAITRDDIFSAAG